MGADENLDNAESVDDVHNGSDGTLSRAPELRFAAISASVDGHQTMREVSFTAPAGQITVVMGERGSGKSLLAQYVIGEAEPDSGDVVIGGQSLSGLSGADRRRLHDSVGVLRGGTRIRESELTESETVIDNLTDQLRETDRVTSEEDARTRARRSLEYFDLSDVADVHPDELDPNMERRVAIAAALLSDPELVVLDDPGSGIDVNHLDSMRRVIKKWHTRTGSTLLLTTHSIEVAKTVGQRLVVLRDGEVAADGDAAELLADIDDLPAFEKRFGTTLSFSEADPERLRRTLHIPSPRAMLTIAVCITLIVIFATLLIGGL